MPTGCGGAGLGSTCMTGSSIGCIGIIAISPRAAWRMACAAGSLGVGLDQRHARVGLLAQRHRERDLAEQRHVELVGQRLAAALAEDREALRRPAS